MMMEFMNLYDVQLLPCDTQNDDAPEQALLAGSSSILAGFVGIVVGLLLCCLLSGCKTTEYVPVETVRTEIVHQTDTVIQRDTVNNEKTTTIREARPEDSALIAKLGIQQQENERLILVLTNELREVKSQKTEKATGDSVRTKEVQVPYPVERKLNRWEQFCLDYGKVTTGITIAAFMSFVFFIIRWLRRKSGK